MFQSVAAWLLQTYVGEYIENLDTEQLSIGYDGVELGNLHLKKSAFKKLRLPIKLISGVIGRFHLVIPYWNPNTQPWIIRIENLSIVTEPDSEIYFEGDEDRLEKWKQKMLADLERQWKASVQHPQSQSWFSSFYSSFSTKIVENLLLEIKDVNIIYMNSENCTFGASLGSLTVQSTDSNWDKDGESKSEFSEMKYKLLELKKLTIYYDDQNILKDSFKKNAQDVHCLLGPVNADARIKRNASKVALSAEDGARFYIEVLLKNVALNLSDKQYKKGLNIIEDVNRYYRGLEYAHNRPKEAVLYNPKKWWKFAIKCVVEPIRKLNERRTKEFFIQRVKDINTYFVLYKDHLLNPNVDIRQNKIIIEDIEKRWKYEELVVIRKLIYSSITDNTKTKKLVANQSANAPTWSEWAYSFNPLWSSSKTAVKSQDFPEIKFTVTKEEQKFLEDLTETYDDESIFNSDVILAHLNFVLKSGSLLLKNEADHLDVLNLQFKELDFESEVRPKSKSWEWSIHLGSVVVKNPCENKAVFPNIFCPQESQVIHERRIQQKFLTVNYGQREMKKIMAYKLNIKLKPSIIVYNQSIFKNLKEFFSNPVKSHHNLMLESPNVQRVVNSQIEALKHATKAELTNVLETLMKGRCLEEDEWNLELDIAAPQLVIPVIRKSSTQSFVEENLVNNMVIFNLGRITFHNTHARNINKVDAIGPSNSDGDEDDDEFVTPSSTPPQEDVIEKIDPHLPKEEIDKQLYDSYALELSQVQILVCEFGNSWIASQSKGFGPDHVVDKFSVCFLLKRRIIFTADSEYPALTLSGVLPQLLIHVDENKLQVIFNCLSMFGSEKSGISPVNSDVQIHNNFNSSKLDETTDLFLESPMQDLLLESKLILAKFTFEKLSLGLHSRGRCFAELQVTGVECEFTKRPYDISVTFILSSLLLIDAIQTFGSDYELLVSSKLPTENVDQAAEDVLIHICYQMINADCPSLGNTESFPVQVLSINFNSLHINGNIETIVELNNVLRQIMPKQSQQSLVVESTASIFDDSIDLEKVQERKVDITASFKTINVLLLRKITKHEVSFPQKVALISIGQLEMTAIVGSNQLISGSIGSIIVTDMSPNDLLCRYTFSVGNQKDLFPLQSFDSPMKAFTFRFCDKCGQKKENLSIHMASAYYMHNPLFLTELVLCAGDYKHYALKLARSLQTTAADMAKSMVSGRKDINQAQSDDISGDSIPKKKPRKDVTDNFLFTCCIESPVVFLPKDESGADFLVGYLGRINIKNAVISKTPGTTERTDQFIIDVEKINLSIVTTDLAYISKLVAKQYHMGDILRNANQVAILQNTDVHLQADNCVQDRSGFKKCNDKIKLEAFINTSVKIFLSLEIYHKVLSIINFATKINDQPMSVPVTPTHISIKNHNNSWERQDSISSTSSTDSHFVARKAITAEFRVPSLELALHGELNGKTQGFVNIVFEQFEVSFTNEPHPFSTYKILLQDFLIEDLLQEKNNQYRYLVSSLKKNSCDFLLAERPSSSYPEEMDVMSVEVLSKSLPNIYSTDDLFFGKNPSRDTKSIPHGPLISVEVIVTDENISEERKEGKKLNIDVSALDVVINLQTWVILLEFLGIGAQNPELSPSELAEMNISESYEDSDDFPPESTETDICLNVDSITIYLNKELYPLARASLSKFGLKMVLADGNQDVDGSIGFIELTDMSPYCGHFHKRLATLGTKAFNFSFYRFGTPDPDLNREHDMDLTISLSAIQYVHSQRFLTEVIAFGQHFIFLQEVLGRIRAAGAGDEVLEMINRAARLCLKVYADAPILILPRNSNSKDLLVANLGKLNVQNQFLYASHPHTNAFRFHASRSRNNLNSDVVDSMEDVDRLLDCISIKLSDMKIFSALAVVDCLGEVTYVEQGHEMMSNACMLDLKLERNLEWAFGRQVPDVSVTGTLSSVHVNLDLSQFSLIMGMLGENLGEQLDEYAAPSSVLVDPLIMPSPSKHVWTTMHVKLHLSNVSIETSPSFSFGNLPSRLDAPSRLAKFDFIQSNLIYESFSDGSKSIDLVSTDVLIHDIRTSDLVGVLLPSHKEEKPKKYLQFEVHYLDTEEKSQLTFLCNQSRIILEFDFLLEVYQFITRKEESDHEVKDSVMAKSVPQSPELEGSTLPGILTKTSASAIESPTNPPKKRFEVKVNITESELVVVEDITDADTATIVLKTTAVFAYRPDTSQKPITCSLESLEVFSCLMSQPEESALSIVDPVAFLIELNSAGKANENKQGFYHVVKQKPVLEVQLQAAVNIRVSYHDIEMFRKIFNSARDQIGKAMRLRSSQDLGEEGNIDDVDVPGKSVNGSRSLGDVMNKSNDAETAEPQNESPLGFEVRAHVISIILIDDAGNNDVPLLDVSFSNLLLRHNDGCSGVARCQLDTNYYNTRVSAWEPFMEEWKFNIHWSKNEKNDNIAIKVDAPDRLDVNLTSALVDITKKTADLWSSRFFSDGLKKRAPFLPFLLRNKTGCRLAFHTLVKSPAKIMKTVKVRDAKNVAVFSKHEFELGSGEEVAFSFEGRSKQRHQASHDLLVHQIVVQVAGWCSIKSLTVDRVGEFYRDVSPLGNNRQSQVDGLHILFDITLEGARKVVTVKSALSVHNQLTFPVDIVGVLNEKHYSLTTIQVDQSYDIPLSMILCKLYCRPLKHNVTYDYCKEDLNWRNVSVNEERGLVQSCTSSSNDVLKFTALIKCIGLPKPNQNDVVEMLQPGHSITLHHTTTLENLLPFDLFYLIQGRTMKEMVKPGCKVPLYCSDDSFEIGFSIENFPGFDMVRVSNDASNYILPSRVYDINHRLLIFNTIISCHCGTLQVTVLAPYWIVNKTGLPIVFKREDDTEEIAGQFEEHEEARSLTPLPFSYLSSEHSFHCQMRLGRHFQQNQGMVSLWSKPFSLEKETQNRTLYVRESKERLERSYDIAIFMAWGNGAFSKTRIISIVPRFQIDNQCDRTVVVAQRHLVQDCQSVNPSGALLCYPRTVSIFHWSTCGYDQILCARLNDDVTMWSGGIRLDCETTYHLNLRSTGKTGDVFIRCHITFNAGTFCCTLSDAASFPPPFKIVNLSDVKLFYWQDGISGMRNCVRPSNEENYVMDQPLMPAKLNVSVYEESMQCYNLKQNGNHFSKLYYQNAIFIAFSHTFYGIPCGRHSDGQNTNHQLVLDVINGDRVVVARKTDHTRSQLWRMNANGNLVHFCASTPKDGRKTNGSSTLVLDIEDNSCSTEREEFRLVLKNTNPQRSKTQTWFFSSNYLKCGLSNFIVRLAGKEQCYPVLSQVLDKEDDYLKSCISRQKMRPGSGVLSARVFSKGPTQVLEISDAHQDVSNASWVIVDRSNKQVTTANNDLSVDKSSSTEISISLAGGIGVSMINLIPEEVLFGTFSLINCLVNYNKTYYDVELQIGSVQIDNQLYGCQVPVAVFASPQKSKSVSNSANFHLYLNAERDTNFDLLVYKNLAIDICNLHIMVEDRLLLKVIQVVQSLMLDNQPEEVSTNIFDSQRISTEKKNLANNIFFEDIAVTQGDITMSLVVTGRLEKDLVVLKKKLGIPLISFESAVIGFEGYHKNNVFETSTMLLQQVLHHYKNTFINKAAVLLGSLDLLGNPMALIQDFSSGVEGLVKKGNIGGLFVNVAHGFSNSAAKMTGVIADGLWSASMDNKFHESRDSMRVARASSSSSHISAGLKGFGMGVIGGLTSMVTQPLEGASKKGVSGFFSGLGKGLVGTVAKPMAGVLDLASGTAAAVRVTTETAVPAPKPVRLKRNCYESRGVLGKYNKAAAEGQVILLNFNEGDTTEMYILVEQVRQSTDKLKAILTNKGIYFVKSGPPCPENIILHVEYSRFSNANYYYEDGKHSIEIYFSRRRHATADFDDRTLVRCENERVAHKVSQKMNYLKSLHEESMFWLSNITTLRP